MINEKFFTGGLAALVARFIISPLDKLKIILQMNKNTYSFSTILKNDIKEFGFRNLWKGNLVNSLRIFPYSGTQFYIYDKCKTNFNMNNNIFLEKIIFGSIAGITAITITQPLDVIRHRLMYYQTKNIKLTLKDIYKEKGIKSFYRGYLSSIIGLTPYIAINFSSYDILKNTIFNNYNYNSDTTLLASSSLSAIISQTICYPLDTIRRRMHVKENNSIIKTTKNIIINEGVKNLYKGMYLNIVKTVPHNIVRFYIFEKLNTLIINN